MYYISRYLNWKLWESFILIYEDVIKPHGFTSWMTQTLPGGGDANSMTQSLFYFPESRRPQSGSSSSASAPPFTFGNLPSLPSFTRLFPVSGTKCTTGSGDAGVCLSQSECDNQGGVKDGNCGTILFNSAGVCCSCKFWQYPTMVTP